ncbi:MAG: DUF3047 domain-containing protein [Pseudomonadota bacterium]
MIAILTLVGPDRGGAEGARTVVEVLNIRNDRQHITFDDKPTTDYTIDNSGVLVATVDRSASFLLYSFDNAVPVSTVQWEWRNTGTPNLLSAEHEESKDGDDAQLRIGLVIHGDPPGVVAAFAPAWIKQVSEHLKLTTNAMLFLISGSKHADGDTWTSPYFKRITHRAVMGTPGPDGWSRSSVTFAEGHAVVGVWLMADGDNTNARFKTQLRNLMLQGAAENVQEEFANESEQK